MRATESGYSNVRPTGGEEEWEAEGGEESKKRERNEGDTDESVPMRVYLVKSPQRNRSPAKQSTHMKVPKHAAGRGARKKESRKEKKEGEREGKSRKT